MYGGPRYGILNPTLLILLLAMLLYFVSIIRSVWLAVKLWDVYENEEKYTISSTSLKNDNNNESGSFNNNILCCVFLIVIFIIFAAVAL